MKFLKTIAVATSFLTLQSCEPGLSGDLKVFNESNQVLVVKFLDNSKDTSIEAIQPHTSITVKVLSGIGSNNAICCPCELDTIAISSPSGKIKKDPTIRENWTIPNQRKLKKFLGPDAKCEFHVREEDL